MDKSEIQRVSFNPDTNASPTTTWELFSLFIYLICSPKQNKDPLQACEQGHYSMRSECLNFYRVNDGINYSFLARLITKHPEYEKILTVTWG